MRPVCRGSSPQTDDFSNYSDAKPELVSRLGPYCSYCERPIHTNFAVEHIQPKGLAEHAHLVGRWNNFLLACVNCNSSKSDKNIDLAQTILPDRDNSFFALRYLPDGRIEPSAAAMSGGFKTMVAATLALTGLDKVPVKTLDSHGKQVALERVSQRIQAWLLAEDAKTDIENNPTDSVLRKSTAKVATASGFFSVWMTVFDGDPDMRNRLIDAFPGVRGSGCFDPISTAPVSPAPNPDGLSHGGKI